MKKKDISSVAYLFKEMDPSEELEFERDLEKNENLLIEVESLRSVQEKLSELPEFSAPDHVLEQVCKQAESKGRAARISPLRPYYYAVAALLLVGFTAGALILEQSGSDSSSADRAVTGFSQFQTDESSSPAAQEPNTEDRAKVSPWVDNNEVLRFGERSQSAESDSMDSVLRDSYNRLTPVTSPSQASPVNRQLHLTGSRP